MILSSCKAGPKANLQLLTSTTMLSSRHVTLSQAWRWRRYQGSGSAGEWHGLDLSQLSSVPSELEDILRKNVDVKDIDTAVFGIMSDER